LNFLKLLSFQVGCADTGGSHDPCRSRSAGTGFVVFSSGVSAAADRVFGELALLSAGQQGIVLYLDGVSILDSGGVNALNKFLDNCKRSDIRVYLADFQYQPLKTLSKAGFRPDGIVCETYASLGDALNSLSILPAETSERA
jgi:anti-anti-sigma regulatory factor